MQLKRYLVLWVMRNLVEDYEVRKHLDHEKMKFLAEVYEKEEFVNYLHYLVSVLTKKVALKADNQEMIWFLRGRIYQTQTLSRSLKEAHLKKQKIEEELKNNQNYA